MKRREWLVLIAIAAGTAVLIGLGVIQGRRGVPWESATAEVSGFGGQGGRRGSVTVFLRNETGNGIIPGVRPDQLNCRIGEKVAVEQSGTVLRGLPTTCRTAAKLPGQAL